MASTTSSSSPFDHALAGGDPDRGHPARHRGLEGTRVVPARGSRALALLREGVGDAVPGEVDGRAVPNQVQRPGTRALPDHEYARPHGIEGEAEGVAVHAHLQPVPRVSHLDVEAVVAAAQAHQRSSPRRHAPRLAHGSGADLARSGASVPPPAQGGGRGGNRLEGRAGARDELRQMLLDEPGVQLSRGERGVLDDRPEPRDVRDDPEDHGAPKGVAHPLDRLRAVLAPGDDLREQRVVVDAHLRADVEARVHPDPGPLRLREVQDTPRRRQVVAVRVLGVEAALEGVPPERHVGLREGKGTARRHLELQPHEVEAAHRLGHRVLDLQPGVHLEEGERAVGREQELDGTRVHVAGRARRGDAGRAQGLPLRGVEGRAGRLLDDLLVPPLDGALALAEVHDATPRVGHHLDLDVPGPLDETLEHHRVVAEGPPGLAARGGERFLEARLAPHDAHALAPAAAGGLEHQRPADPAGLGEEPRVRLLVAVVAGHDGDAGRRHQAARRPLVPHAPVHVARRADEDEAGALHRVGEVAALAQEAVAGVDGVGPRRARGAEQPVDREVGLPRLGGTDRDRLVGLADVPRGPVGLRVDGHGRNPEDAAGADDPHRDLPAVGDQDLAEQRHAGYFSTEPGRRLSLQPQQPQHEDGASSYCGVSPAKSSTRPTRPRTTSAAGTSRQPSRYDSSRSA